ncbi:hypothetical protein RAS1_41090 [Phycisphaerae bacterium RAS1]|nr:hypothetical protein RAS1_41090 [Phycisphaerae bacterium RAS1]
MSRTALWTACFLLGAMLGALLVGGGTGAAATVATTQPNPTTRTRQRLYKLVTSRDNAPEIFSHARMFRQAPSWEQNELRTLHVLIEAFVASQSDATRRSLLDLPEIARAVRVLKLMEDQQPQQVAALAARRRTGPP